MSQITLMLLMNIAYSLAIPMQPNCYLNQMVKRDITGSYLSVCFIVSSCNCGLSCYSSQCQLIYFIYI